MIVVVIFLSAMHVLECIEFYFFPLFIYLFLLVGFYRSSDMLLGT